MQHMITATMAVFPRVWFSRRTFRVFLSVLLLATVLTVLVFYGATSGAIVEHQHRSVTAKSRLTTAAAQHNSADQLVTAKVADQAVTLKLPQGLGEHSNGTNASSGVKVKLSADTVDVNAGLTDYRRIDITESMECDEQCQQNVQRLRQSGVAQACAKRRRPSIWDEDGNLRASQLIRLNHLFPIEGSKMIYCSVPKDGCSAWKRILMRVAGFDPEKFPGNIHPTFAARIKPLSKYTVTEAQRRLRTYNKYLFVREPMDRMLSLFLDKALDKHDFAFNETQFEDFLRFMLKKPVRGRSLGYSEHWTHASYLCLPCDVNYTFIGRLETSKRDSEYVFDHFVHPSVGELSMPTKIHKTHSSDPDIKSRYFSQVNRTVLERIYDRYSIDYKMFSYIKPRILKKDSRGSYKDKLR